MHTLHTYKIGNNTMQKIQYSIPVRKSINSYQSNTVSFDKTTQTKAAGCRARFSLLYNTVCRPTL